MSRTISPQALFQDFCYANDQEQAYFRQHPLRVTHNLGALAYLGLPAGARMLEIGCAWGGFAMLVRRHLGLEVVGLDCYAELVAAARQRGIPALQTDVENEGIPLAGSTFDVVFFDSVIEHLYHPAHALDEIYRVLKPGGYLLLGCPNVVSLNRRLQMWGGQNPFTQYHRYNAIEGQPPIMRCSVLYSPTDVAEVLWTRFTVERVDYTVHLDLAERAHASLPLRAWDIVRRTLCRLYPPWGDSFLVTARSDKGGVLEKGGVPLPSRYPPGGTPAYSCAYLGRSGDPALSPGAQAVLTVRFRNTGTAVWRREGENPVRLGTAQPFDRASALYTPEKWLSPHRPAGLQEEQVLPGQTGAFSFPVTAPATPGYYLEHFVPVAEGAAWMEDWGAGWGVEVRG